MKRIKYKFLSGVANGEEHFIIKDSSYSEDALAGAKREAYNGEYEAYEVADEVIEPTTDDILNAMLGVE